VAANAGNARTGHITIGGRSFTVNQYAAASVTISPVTRDFSADGGSGTISVTANTTWAATTTTSWIHIVPPSSGSGNAVVSYTVDTNPSSANRSGTITLGGNTFAVQQLGTTPSLVVSPLAFDFAPAGGNGTITVTANTSWTASTPAFWVNLSSSGTNGSGDGTIYFNVSPNPGSTSRSTVITIGGTTVLVNQLGVSPKVTISPASSTFSAQPDSGTITITANTSWSAAANQAWIHLLAPASGSGNGVCDRSVTQS
jgi:hypothetical protein